VQVHCARHHAHNGPGKDLAALRADAVEILGALEANAVPRPSLWRPPYGQLNNPHSFIAGDESGLQIVLWTHNTDRGWHPNRANCSTANEARRVDRACA